MNKMFPRWHISIGILFSLILFFLFPEIGFIGCLIIITSTVLIDFDHYAYYAFKKRDLSLERAYNWYISRQKKLLALSRKKRNKIPGPFLFLHGIEPLLVLFLFGLFLSNYFFYILIGFAFHLFLDVIYQRKFQDRFDRISIIYDTLKFRKLRFLN